MEGSGANARLVMLIGKPGFAEGLLAAAGACLPHDAAALMVFHPAGPPSVLVDRLKPAERAWLYGDYVSGVYALSPFYRAAQKLKAPRVARVREIAPKGFAQSEYHRRYFALIGVDDMIGLLIPVSAAAGETVFMSFSRSTGRPRFTTRDVAALGRSAEFLSAAIARHCEIAGPLAGRGNTPAAAAPARTPPNCQAPDHYLVPKVPLRHAAQALRTDKQLRVLVFSSVRSSAIPESIEAKRYPASLTQALVARYPGRTVSVTTHTEPQAPIGESLKALKSTLADKTFDVVVWQLGSTDVLRGTDMAVFGAKLVSGIGAIQARNADAVLMTMQYSPRTDFMFDAGPYMQYLRWVAKTEGSALFNRYDVMRYWVEDGSFDLSELQPGASVFEDVHRCVGQLLARFIANGIAAPESQ